MRRKTSDWMGHREGRVGIGRLNIVTWNLTQSLNGQLTGILI